MFNTQRKRFIVDVTVPTDQTSSENVISLLTYSGLKIDSIDHPIISFTISEVSGQVAYPEFMPYIAINTEKDSQTIQPTINEEGFAFIYEASQLV